ncbi:putative 50S ribosomal subunit protein L6 [Candidatus Hodgkinia cicadicola Dsem]|nr:putative 50S ribosomal subunit protein L6 [Candidatus Hodgkinia cicadicola Dsem]
MQAGLACALPAGVRWCACGGDVGVIGRVGCERLPQAVFVKGRCALVGAAGARSLRAETLNAVKGVRWGHVRWLAVRGHGCKVAASGRRVELKLGFSHAVNVELKPQVRAFAHDSVKLKLVGASLQSVAAQACAIKSFKAPDAYSARGVSYRLERLHTKVGKKK